MSDQMTKQEFWDACALAVVRSIAGRYCEGGQSFGSHIADHAAEIAEYMEMKRDAKLKERERALRSW